MFSHVFVGVTDFQRAFRFYAAIMEKLDLQLKFCDVDKPWAAWMAEGKTRPLFIIGEPYNGEIAVSGNGQMIALLAATRTAVDGAYAVAMQNGGRCEGPPGLRLEYHPHYYGAYFRDADGNKMCVCCHDAPVTQVA
jgi:catechol 2,3-dioxygenase-like lactoylglutathione lyase family enzyme